jgi:hypothetical protein
MFNRYYNIDWNKVMNETIIVYDKVYLKSYVTPALLEQMDELENEVLKNDLTDAKDLLKRIKK